MTEFDNDVCTFADGLRALEEALGSLEQEARVRAARTARLLDGRSRLEMAKTYAREVVETRLRPDGIPEVVRNFLLTHWKHLLITLFARDGEDSATLREAVRTMDELVWSVLPKTSRQARDKLTRLLPRLLPRLKQGMEAVSVPPVARSGFLTRLARAHTEAMRGEAKNAAVQPAAAVEDRAGMIVSEEDGNVQDITTGAWQPEANAAAAAATETKIENVEPTPVASPQVSALDPRKKAILAAIMRRVREAQMARSGQGGATSGEPPAPPAPPLAATPPEGVIRGEAGSVVYPRIPADIRAAMHEIRTEPPELPFIEPARQLQTAAQSDWQDVTEPPVPSVAERMRQRLDTEEEVQLADVMRKNAVQAASAVALPPADESVLDITANTFYRMFSNDSGGNASVPNVGAFNIEELTLGETRNPVMREADDEHQKTVKNLEPGTWLEFRHEDGSTFRARFTWYNANTDTYIFTDRNGRKVADRTHNGLVAEFRRGSACVTHDTPLLDRAFTRLVDTLNLGEPPDDRNE
ncbi:MAG: DUF1631 family protein [Chromatiales bacterium]